MYLVFRAEVSTFFSLHFFALYSYYEQKHLVLFYIFKCSFFFEPKCQNSISLSIFMHCIIKCSKDWFDSIYRQESVAVRPATGEIAASMSAPTVAMVTAASSGAAARWAPSVTTWAAIVCATVPLAGQVLGAMNVSLWSPYILGSQSAQVSGGTCLCCLICRLRIVLTCCLRIVIVCCLGIVLIFPKDSVDLS